MRLCADNPQGKNKGGDVTLFAASREAVGSNCTGAGCTVYADVLERIYALSQLKKDYRSFKTFPVYLETGEEQKYMTKKSV